ncbi:VWA domain-containing protein, partial [Verrucomicrobia bacterium]|nr:VWA domain-containing protein [Verrucomicrobiota bacterium]
MNIQFSNPGFLWWLLLVVPGVVWLCRHSDSSLSPWRLWVSCFVRLLLVVALTLAMAGLQWLNPQEGLNVVFLLDRSESVPSAQQDAARRYVNEVVKLKEEEDQAGVIVFGADTGIEQMVQERVALGTIQAVVATDRTDIAAAVRLGTASFPQYGQKRLVLISDGNENIGDALTAVAAAQPLGVSLDVVPLGAERRNDISLQRLGLPGNVKKGTTFEAKIFAISDEPGPATVRLFRNDRLLGEQEVALESGKNLFTFPQTLPNSGFYTYDVEIAAAGDMIAQNNRAISFVNVVGDPRILIVSDDPVQDQPLADALLSSQLEVVLTDLSGFPESLAEMQSYDAIFLSNIAAGDLGNGPMRQLESAVKDFGVGLVCVGGDQTYAAGGYRGTPLERALPVDMELSSKKVLPSGALAMVMHGMEFNNGNQVARRVAIGVLDALGPQDELGIVLWDGTDRWLFPLTKVGDRRGLGSKIMGMNQGDLPNFQNVMSMAFEGLKESSANLKHMIIFSDGDPGAPSE